MDNEKQVILVTGGTRGIGLAIAQALATPTNQVVINAHHEPDEVFQATLGDIDVVVGDVAVEADAQAMIYTIMERYGRIDVLVNNAGITRDKLLSRMKLADFQAVIDTNLVGAFNMTKAAMKIMQKQRRGCIVNMSSIAGTNGNLGQANYSASKAGLIGLTKTTAQEGALRHIRCNAIAPGMINTDMTAKLSERVVEQFVEKIPLGRFGEPGEIALTVKFLIDNPYITGQVLKVDGGLTM